MNKLFGKTATLVVGTLLAVGLASCSNASSEFARVAKADSVFTDCDFSKVTAADGAANYTSTWSYSGFTVKNGNNNKGNSQWKHVRFGQKATATENPKNCTGSISSGALESAITKVEITVLACGESKITADNSSATLGLTVYSDEEMETVVDTIAPDEVDFKTATTIAFIPTSGDEWATGYYYQVNIATSTTQTDKNGILLIEKVSFYTAEEDPRTTVNLNADDISINVSDAALSPSVKDDAGAAVTGCSFASDNELAVKVVDGQLVPVEVGEATIAVSKASDAEHHYTATTFKATVVDPDVTRTTLTFTKDIVVSSEEGAAVTTYRPSDDDAIEGTTVVITSDGEKSAFDNSKGIHFGTGSKAVKYIEVKISGITGNVTKLVVNASTANGGSANVSATVGNGAMVLQGEEAASATPAFFILTGSASGEIIVRLEKPGEEATNGALYIKSISIGVGQNPEPPTPPTPPTPTPTPSGNKGCGGDIATVSIILSAISLAGVGLLLLKKRVKE